MPSQLRVGYFPDFRWDPTILFFGDAEALHILADFFDSLGEGEEVALDETHGFCPIAGLKMVISVAVEPIGLTMTSIDEYYAIQWGISLREASLFAMRVRGVVGSDGPCHDYLDSTQNDDARVVVSKDEYPPTFE